MTRFEDTPMPRSRPRLAELDATNQPVRSRNEIGPVGVHTQPADCPHPVEARVTALIAGYTARCGDCGSYLDRHDGEWVVLRWRPEL